MSYLNEGDTLLLASANQGKVIELSRLLKPYHINLVSISDYTTDELQEDGTTFEANALQKAHFAANLSQLPCLADDSGFCVSALDGDPGIYSARWAGPQKDFAAAMESIHSKMPKGASTKAYFVCVLALALPNGAQAVFRGEVHGDFIWPPRGDYGFGYDPVFLPQGKALSFGEMPPQDKEKISHRAIAFEKFTAAILAPLIP